ncbi:hypothetical protein C0J52_20299 [Blattella germanica]|nr:hypothetical protein C0J52_20299 [Blattella germanica]
MKWTKKLFFHLTDLTILNSYILLTSCGAKLTHRDFRLRLVLELVEQGGSHGASYKILSDDLNMFHVTQYSMPRILSQDKGHDRIMICGDLISSVDDPTFIDRIITGDET